MELNITCNIHLESMTDSTGKQVQVLLSVILTGDHQGFLQFHLPNVEMVPP